MRRVGGCGRRVAASLLVVALAVTGLGSAAAAARSSAGGSSYQPVLKAAIADLAAYWTTEFPQLYGGSYPPVGQIVAGGPGARIPSCQGQSLSYQHDVQGNAFYCFKSNFIVYDDHTLFPQLAKGFGTFAPALVLAHEWGHAIQDRAGIDRTNQPTIFVELQADCFAGSWVQRLVNGQGTKIKFAPGDLDAALAAYLRFRDPVGTGPNDQQSHGNAFDRVNAFQTGVESGAAACKPFFDQHPPVTEQPLTSQEAQNGTNLPAKDVLPATMDTLGSYYQQVDPSVPALPLSRVFKYTSSGSASQLPKCGGSVPPRSALKNRTFYCLDDDYIAFDTPLLDRVYQGIGDFGVSVLIAGSYATDVQFKEKFPGVATNTVNAVLGADCYTGSWAGHLEQATVDGQGVPAPSINTTVSLAADDLDKVIEAFLAYDALRGVPSTTDFLFRRLEAFRQGFFNGFSSCQTTFATAGS